LVDLPDFGVLAFFVFAFGAVGALGFDVPGVAGFEKAGSTGEIDPLDSVPGQRRGRSSRLTGSAWKAKPIC
jgi:hypothetical protein